MGSATIVATTCGSRVVRPGARAPGAGPVHYAARETSRGGFLVLLSRYDVGGARSNDYGVREHAAASANTGDELHCMAVASPLRIVLGWDFDHGTAAVSLDGKRVTFSRSYKGGTESSPYNTRVALALYLASIAPDRSFGHDRHQHKLRRFAAWTGSAESSSTWARDVRDMVRNQGWCEEKPPHRDSGAFRLVAAVDVAQDEAFQSWFAASCRGQRKRTRILDLITRTTAPWRDPCVLTEGDLAAVPLASRSRVIESSVLLAQAWEVRRSESGARGSEPLLRESISRLIDRSVSSTAPLPLVADALLRNVRADVTARPLAIEGALGIALLVEIAVTLRYQFRFQEDWRITKSLLELLAERTPSSPSAFASWATERAILVAAMSAANARRVDELLKLVGAASLDDLAHDFKELKAATPDPKDVRVAIASAVAVAAAAAADDAVLKRAMKDLFSTRTGRPEDDFPLIVAAVCGHDRKNALDELDRWRAEFRGTTHRDPYWREMVAMAAVNPTITFVDLCSEIENRHAAGRSASHPRSTSPAGGGTEGRGRRVRPARRRSGA